MGATLPINLLISILTSASPKTDSTQANKPCNDTTKMPLAKTYEEYVGKKEVKLSGYWNPENKEVVDYLLENYCYDSETGTAEIIVAKYEKNQVNSLGALENIARVLSRIAFPYREISECSDEYKKFEVNLSRYLAQHNHNHLPNPNKLQPGDIIEIPKDVAEYLTLLNYASEHRGLVEDNYHLKEMVDKMAWVNDSLENNEHALNEHINQRQWYIDKLRQANDELEKRLKAYEKRGKFGIEPGYERWDGMNIGNLSFNIPLYNSLYAGIVPEFGKDKTNPVAKEKITEPVNGFFGVSKEISEMNRILAGAGLKIGYNGELVNVAVFGGADWLKNTQDLTIEEAIYNNTNNVEVARNKDSYCFPEESWLGKAGVEAGIGTKNLKINGTAGIRGKKPFYGVSGSLYFK